MQTDTSEREKAKDGLQTRRDFCGRPMLAMVWNSRTCVKCAVAGAPDQSDGARYERRLFAYQRAVGIKPPLKGRAAKLAPA